MARVFFQLAGLGVFLGQKGVSIGSSSFFNIFIKETSSKMEIMQKVDKKRGEKDVNWQNQWFFNKLLEKFIKIGQKRVKKDCFLQKMIKKSCF